MTLLNTTDRLYYQDAHLTEFEASVVAVKTNPAGVILNRTAFYPTGGGQPTDTGLLGEARVTECIDLEDEGVLHLLEESVPQIGETIRGRIDWPRRLDHMQQHTAQHILSRALHQLYGTETRGFRMMERASEIDVALADPSDERIERAVDFANQIIWEDRALRTRFVTADEARRLPLVKDSARRGELRIVEIDGFDMNACGGTHARRTGEVGLVVVRSWERAKGMTRIEFLAGVRALADYRRANTVARGVAALFSVGRDDASAAVERLFEEQRSLVRRLHGFEETGARVEAEALLGAAAIRVRDGARVVARSLADKGMDDLKQLAQLLVARPRTIALLASSGAEASAARLVCARSDDLRDDMNILLRSAVSHMEGRGGGTASFAQGGGRAAPQALAQIVADLQRQVLNS